MSYPDAAERVEPVSRSESAPAAEAFPRDLRLTTRRQFLAIYDRGRRASTPAFVLFGCHTQLSHPRLGLTVSRKFGDSVRRNRLKRRLREIFRRNRAHLSAPLDIVVNARGAAGTLEFKELESQFVQTFADLARKFQR